MGDQGQRYEVRYVMKVHGERVLGFTDDMAQAAAIVDLIVTQHPELVTEAFVIDRHDNSEQLICLTCRGKHVQCSVCGGSGFLTN